MYHLANTTVTILRGFAYDDEGDMTQQGVPVYSGIFAFISPPAQSPFRPVVFGTTIYQPAAEIPSTTREIPAVLPGNTDITNEDQIYDERTGLTYQVELVTQPGWTGGLIPDMQLTLKRVTTTQPV
jgi:hypothetical protein